MLNSLIVKILAGIGFFFFVFDFVFIMMYKNKSRDTKYKNNNRISISKKRIIAIIGIISIEVLLFFCCFNVFFYEYMNIFIPRINFFFLDIYLQITGFILIIIGDIILIIAYHELGSSWSFPLDNWKNKKRLVTTGIYNKIRHPIYLSFNIISIGFVLLLADWLLLILAFIGGIGLYFQALLEENLLIIYFKEDYINYIKVSRRFII